MEFGRSLLLCVVGVYLIGCASGPLLRKRAHSTDPVMAELVQNPLPAEDSEELLNEIGKNWVYGPGLGCTAINIGTAIVFPPYAAYVLTNTVLTVSGYEPMYVSSLLPDEDREEFNQVHEEVCSVPGRVNAAVSGEEYRTRQDGAAIVKSVYTKALDGRKVPTKGQIGPPKPEFR